MRVALIHALAQSMAPVNEEMAASWPTCERMNLLDDSLSADLARAGRLDSAMTDRFLRLAEYAAQSGAAGILFSCSAFGPCIEEVARRLAPLPVLKPNQAMIDDAAAVGGRIGLVATFGRTLESMPPEFPADLDLRLAHAGGGLEALQAGDGARHDAIVVTAARRLVHDEGCTAIALAQFSMARAAPRVAAELGVPVLTPVASAVRALQQALTERNRQ
jgi:Asp/Glu/hydantoin racemase